MKKLIPIVMLTAALIASRAVAQTQDNILNVALLPDTPYKATATVSTNDAAALLALLTGSPNPLQVLDPNGKILGQLPTQDLIDLLTGLTGAVTKVIEIPLDAVTNTVDHLIVRTIDSPLVQVSNVAVQSDPSRDRRPTLTLKRMIRRGQKVVLRGKAEDDFAIQKVEVMTNHRERVASGTANWHATVRLQKGKNRIRVRAIDSGNQLSATKRVVITR